MKVVEAFQILTDPDRRQEYDRTIGVYSPESTLASASSESEIRESLGESKELLASTWAEVGGRRRRVYDLTPAGQEALRRERLEWGSFTQAVESVLESV